MYVAYGVSVRCVLDAAPPVLGEVSPTFLIQQEGDTVDMFCEATAAPSPSLTWRKDGRELTPTSDDRVRVYGNRVQLRRLQRTDGGAYSCTFTNVVGQATHVIKLVVEGRPATITKTIFRTPQPSNGPLSTTKERPYVTFRNKMRVLNVRCRKNNVRARYAYVKRQLQSWKNCLVSPITKSTILHIYEMR